MKFSIGDKVVWKSVVRARTSYQVMQVVGYLDGAVLTSHYGYGFGAEIHYEDMSGYFKPGSKNWTQAITRYQEEDLLTPAETVAELHRLETVRSNLEKEFESVRGTIVSKLQQAAEIMQEAATLVVEHKKSFDDLKKECLPLYDAMQKGGWRNSSMSC